MYIHKKVLFCTQIKISDMKKVWILMYVDNDYNQPEKAFAELWWHKPTYEDLQKYGFTEDDAKRQNKPNRCGETEYWIESFTE